MRVLIGNTVKTEFADYPCATREEAEALFMSLRDREAEHPQSRTPVATPKAAAPKKDQAH